MNIEHDGQRLRICVSRPKVHRVSPHGKTCWSIHDTGTGRVVARGRYQRGSLIQEGGSLAIGGELRDALLRAVSGEPEKPVAPVEPTPERYQPPPAPLPFLTREVTPEKVAETLAIADAMSDEERELAVAMAEDLLAPAPPISTAELPAEDPVVAPGSDHPDGGVVVEGASSPPLAPELPAAPTADTEPSPDGD
jgi:hypothetical protein